MGITALLDEPLYTGTTASSSEVPGRFPVALAGRGFMLDSSSDQFRRASIALLRQQADQSDQPAEASVNPEDLWRRSVTTWHKGAGQRNWDSAESDPARFFESKGVDPWIKGQLTLLPATEEVHASANVNLRLAVAGTYLYFADGAEVTYTQDLSSFTDVTGVPATAPTTITSDGFSVYSSHGADGLHVTTRGAASTAKWLDDGIDGVEYVKGRLFGWEGKALYNLTDIDSGGTKAWADQDLVLDHHNVDWLWTAIGEAGDFYYFGGFSGDKSLIYRSAVKDDGTGLDTAEVAAALPDGEVVRTLYGYLGFLLIGTDQGIRFAVVSQDGDLTLGGLINVGSSVRCFEGQDRFVWFGWSQFDGASTGLGRIDLSTFNNDRPAYASDLMATENGDVTSVVTFGTRRVFAVSGDGIFAEHATDLVASGHVSTGRITYGLFDPKVSMFITANHEPLAGALVCEMSRDGADYVALGANEAASSTRSDFPTNRARAEAFEIRMSLASDGSAAAGPTLGRFTLRSKPAAARSEEIFVPLLLGFEQRDLSDSICGRSSLDDLFFLGDLEANGDSFTYQEAGVGMTVVAEDHVWMPKHLEAQGSGFNGTYLIRLKRFATE